MAAFGREGIPVHAQRLEQTVRQHDVPVLATLAQPQHPLFVGGSPEAGNIWRGAQEPAFDRALFGGSVNSALDTLLGPIYVGLRLANEGQEAVFLRLGQPY